MSASDVAQHAQLLGAALHMLGDLADPATEDPARQRLDHEQRAQPSRRFAGPDPPRHVAGRQRGKDRQRVARPRGRQPGRRKGPAAARRRCPLSSARRGRRRRALPEGRSSAPAREPPAADRGSLPGPPASATSPPASLPRRWSAATTGARTGCRGRRGPGRPHTGDVRTGSARPSHQCLATSRRGGVRRARRT